uniref:NADH dehydrogenase subunit 6 n=1 Tax=Amblyomma breviscutatum TaxID=3134081 RepID=UPI0030FF28EC
MNIILFLAILLISMSHPMTMLISVILLTLFISIFFYANSCNTLFPLILILLILGGMLIIFLYMISLCPNKKMDFNFKILLASTIFLLFNFDSKAFKFLNEELTKIYFSPQIVMMLLIMNYLMITLMVVLKMLNWISSPLKSF